MSDLSITTDSSVPVLTLAAAERIATAVNAKAGGHSSGILGLAHVDGRFEVGGVDARADYPEEGWFRVRVPWADERPVAALDVAWLAHHTGQFGGGITVGWDFVAETNRAP